MMKKLLNPLEQINRKIISSWKINSSCMRYLQKMGGKLVGGTISRIWTAILIKDTASAITHFIGQDAQPLVSVIKHPILTHTL